MDARRQKRLGPAPIASFEKSFEDNTTTAATTVAAAATTVAAAATTIPQQQQQRVTLQSSVLDCEIPCAVALQQPNKYLHVIRHAEGLMMPH
ncbi:hypothetical protein ACLKA7_011852 [Drosophila subpalustris]